MPEAATTAVEVCVVEGCSREAKAPRVMCWSHYQRVRRHGDPEGGRPVRKRCDVPGCERPHACQNLCAAHYGRWVRTGDPLGSGAPIRDRAEPTIPDPAPVRALRVELGRRRSLGEGFAFAWSAGLANALGTLPAGLRAEWRDVLTEPAMRAAWRSAFLREPEGKPAALRTLVPVDDDYGIAFVSRSAHAGDSGPSEWPTCAPLPRGAATRS